jgi:hypothetical protein
MIKFNANQLIEIRKLNPSTDSRFKYNANRWSGLNHDFKYLIQDYENQDISRQNIIDAYSEYFADDSKSFMRAFLLTMIWGFSDTGYGTHRTNKYINNNDNINRIQEAITFIQQNNPDSLKNAFKKLKEIDGLGVSYLTKILYFATRAKNTDNYALIFDIRVAAALIKLTTPKEVYEIVNVGPSPKFGDYLKYISLIHNIALEYQVEADQIEMYLFNQDFG